MVCYVCFEKKKKERKKKGKEAIKQKAENTLTHIISCVSDWSGYRGLIIDITCVLYVPDLQLWFKFHHRFKLCFSFYETRCRTLP